MFGRSNRKAQEAASTLDFSELLRDPNSFLLGQLGELGLGSELSAFAYDPVQSLLAVGTAAGRLFVFGGPAVQFSWDCAKGQRIKHLTFRAGSGFLCCVDAKETLSVYDLGRIEKDKPVRDSSLSMRSAITCIETSPVLPFLFLGGKDGTVDVFDLDRGCLSREARIPNVWLAQEELLRRSGVDDAPSRRHIPVCTDIKIHPTDYNLLLVAYEGGVALWNIANRKVDRVWEYIIPPGAPGGGNDLEDRLFSERRLAVTCLAFRPDGLMFAAGHEDGCLSFTCISDELAISIRTIEKADVNKTTESDLFGWSAQGEIGQREPVNREPIFRLAWSGFPEETYYEKWTGAAPTSPTTSASSPMPQRTHTAGGTVLTIMGGLLPADPIGIHLFEMPTYVPPTTQNTVTASGNISVPLRQALKDSVTPLQHNIYPTTTPPEDFLLLPRHSPHYGNVYDPLAIIITTSSDASLPVLAAPHATTGIEAWTFPPTSTNRPRPLHLPGALTWSGAGTVTSCEVIALLSLAYRRILHQDESILSEASSSRLPLHGGKALPRQRPRAGPHVESTPRILLSTDVGLRIRFWDVSDHLMGRGADDMQPMEKEFPRPLEHLTVDLRSVLRSRSARRMEASRILRERPWELEITKVSLARESLELAVLFSTGDLMVLRFRYGDVDSYEPFRSEDDLDDSVSDALENLNLQPPIPSADPSSANFDQSKSLRRKSNATSKSAQPQFDARDHHIDLSSCPNPYGHLDGFRPVVAFAIPPSAESCIVMSDVGFLAASSDANLLLADLRSLEVLLYNTAEVEGNKGNGKRKSDPSSITSLNFTISAVGDDRDRSPRLIAIQASGSTRIFELSHVAGTWMLSSNVVALSHDSTAGAFASFVLDKRGNEIHADSGNLQAALAHQASFTSDLDNVKGSLSSLWVTVNRSAVAVYFNFDGPKIASFESTDGFASAAVVTRFGCTVLVICSRNRTLTILSLPDLNQIARMPFTAAVHTSIGSISCSQDGEVLQVLDPLNIRLHTAFDIGRPAWPPTVTLHRPEIAVPYQPVTLTGVMSTLGSWIGQQRVYTAAEIEIFLGGPQRPPPKQRGPVVAAAPRVRSTPGPRHREEEVQEQADSTNYYLARATEALQQRGETLGVLKESLGKMADDAANFAKESKKSAQKEAAKMTLKGGFNAYFK